MLPTLMRTRQMRMKQDARGNRRTRPGDGVRAGSWDLGTRGAAAARSQERAAATSGLFQISYRVFALTAAAAGVEGSA
jgi:hypothetical protein